MAVTLPAGSSIVTTPALPLPLPKTAVLALFQSASTVPFAQRIFPATVSQLPLPSVGCAGFEPLASQVKLAASAGSAAAATVAAAEASSSHRPALIRRVVETFESTRDRPLRNDATCMMRFSPPESSWMDPMTVFFAPATASASPSPRTDLSFLASSNDGITIDLTRLVSHPIFG